MILIRLIHTAVSVLTDATVGLTAIKNKINDVYTRQGAPAGASQSADVAAVQTKLGTPFGASIAADLLTIHLEADTAKNSVVDLNGKVTSIDSSIKLVCPDLVDGTALSTSVVAWTMGNWTNMLATNAQTTQFRVVGFVVESMTAAGIFEVEFASGPALSEVPIGKARFASTGYYPLGSQAIAANLAISARLASKLGTETATISIVYAGASS